VAIVFLNYLRQKFEPIDIDRYILSSLLAYIQPTDTTSAESLEQPITLEEVTTAIRSGAKHKTPGIDGICLEFYSANWETVHQDLLELLNQTFLNNAITPSRSTGSSFAYRSWKEMTTPTDTALYRFSTPITKFWQGF
jgi:hypothetical protein